MKKYINFGFVAIAAITMMISCKTPDSSKKDVNENIDVSQEVKLIKAKGPEILIKTTMGDIKIKLYDETPKHRDNIVKLATEKYYDGTLFHRVIQEFMIQGGDPDSKNAKAGQALGEGGPDYDVDAEFVEGIIHKRGALAAAREGDDVNPEKKSAGSQFYIVQGKTYTDEQLTKIEQKMKIKISNEAKEIYKTIGGTPFLDQNYTVFGEVIEGMETVDKIAAVEKDKMDRPLEDVVIKSVRVITK